MSSRFFVRGASPGHCSRSCSAPSAAPKWSWSCIFLVILATTPAADGVHRTPTRRAIARSGAALGGSLLFGIAPPSSVLAKAVSPPAICDTAVDVITGPDRTYFLCGTAHISKDSAQLVREVIRAVRPDSVMIELDRARFDSIMAEPTERGNVDSERDIVRGLWADLRGPGSFGERVKRAQSNAIGRSLAAMYDEMQGLGFESGDEFRVAATEALNSGAQLVLGDQDIRVTLDSLRDALAKTDPRALFAQPEVRLQLPGDGGSTQMSALVAGGQPIDSSSVARMVDLLKERENTRALVAALRQATPELHRALIANRDAFMARSLAGANGRTVVAVVGMAHLDGIGAALRLADPSLRAQAPKRGCPAGLERAEA